MVRLLLVLAAVSCLLAGAGAQDPKGGGNSAATITGTFADEHCYDFIVGSPGDGLICQMASPPTVWTSASEIPPNSVNDKLLIWACGFLTTRCPPIFHFRGTGSSDPDGDIVTWSLAFGDGTSATGSWNTDPPADVVHEYSPDPSGGFCPAPFCVITLTVTDAAGRSHSNTLLMGFVDQTPD